MIVINAPFSDTPIVVAVPAPSPELAASVAALSVRLSQRVVDDTDVIRESTC